MDILVVGGGGREHAIIQKLKQSPDCGKLYAAPGNGGMAADAVCTGIPATDFDSILAFVEGNGIQYVVVAPDDPLVGGLVDRLTAIGVPAFGPTGAAARIEGSKAFSKDLMKRYRIPTAAYATFDDSAKACAYLETQDSFPVVIKADGLALGKGVIIAANLDEAREAVRSMMEDRRFGDSGNRVVIEEFLRGPEVSVLAFCDGKTVVPMVSSMDHKRALTGNLGPNTGGMGAIAPNPHYDDETARICMDTIFRPTLRAMEREGCPFRGCLYFGLMLTAKGPMVIEYNCRFGDPETQVVLPLLESDLLAIMQACSAGTLQPDIVKFSSGAAACVVMASGGYPGNYSTGHVISGLEEAAAQPDSLVYHAGTRRFKGEVQTAGGRVLGVTATGSTLEEAIAKSYAATEKISFFNAYYRTDIGKY